MALRKVTKSVLFYKGMTDDTERFLAKSPAVDYTENLYEEKTGAYSKRQGFNQLVTAPSSVRSCAGIHSAGDTFYFISTDRAYSYDGTLSQVENNGDVRIRGLDIEAKSHPLPGARDFVFCKRPDDNGYCIAFSVKTSDATSVVVQSYASDGTIRGEQRLVNASDPHLEIHDSQWVNLWVHNTQPLLPVLRYRYDPSNNSFDPANNGVPVVDAQLAGNWTFLRGVSALAPVSVSWEARAGFANSEREHLNSPTQYAWNDNGLGYIFYMTSTSPSLRVNPLGAAFPPPFVVEPYSAAKTFNPLAIQMSPDGNAVYVMWAERESTGSLSNQHHERLMLARYKYNGVSWTREWDRALYERDFFLWKKFFPHASLKLTTTGTVLAMWHDVPYEYSLFEAENVADWEPSKECQIRYSEHATLTGTPFGISGTIANHRLASNIVEHAGSFYAVLQQWSITSPGSVSTAAEKVQNSLLPAKTKPVSSVLCKIGGGGSVSVLGVMGAGGSRWTDPTSDETTTHLPTLRVEGNDFVYINREVLAQEDVAYSIDDQAGSKDARKSLAPCEARGALNRIKYDVSDVEVHSFGNGVFINAATPLWISGNTLSEACVLERPEITGVESVAVDTTIQWELRSDLGTVEDEWRRIQIIIGYTDSSGNVHRSAPSNMLWMSRSGTKSDRRRLKVNFAPPLSALSGRRDYYVEAYVSEGPSDPLRYAGARTIKADDTTTWDDFYVEFDLIVNPVASANTVENDRYIPKRASRNIYTTSDLAAIPWPSIKTMTVTSRRMWALSKQHTGSVFYSKLFEENVAPELAGELVIPLGEERDLVGIGTLDDKAIVFEKDDIHVIYGQGPDNRGRGQDFAVEYIVTGGIGCSQPRSIIECPLGLIFYNEARGFYLLDRNRQLQYIGAGVKNLSRNITVHSATVVPREAEVRFLVSSSNPVDSDGPDSDTTAVDRPPRPHFGNSLPENACLSYNYESGIWALYTNFPGVVSTMYRGDYVKGYANETLNGRWYFERETLDNWRDTFGENRTLLRSHWIELGAQVQDYQRVWKITLLGRYLSSLQQFETGDYEAGDVRVRVYYDYEADYSQEETYHFQDFGFDPFDDPQRRTERFQFILEPNRGRCQAIKLEIEEVNSEDRGEGLTYSLGRGFEIVAADFEIGVDDQQSTRFLGHGARR